MTTTKKLKFMALIVTILAGFLLIFFTAARAESTGGIKNITVAPGENSACRFVTWQSDSGQEESLELYQVDQDGNRQMKANTFQVNPSDSVSKEGFYTYRVALKDIFTGIQSYSYRVGSASAGWSDYYPINSSNRDGDNAFSFLFAGDTQIGSGEKKADTDGWNMSLDKARSWFGDDIEFLITAGDQVNNGDDEAEYDGFFHPNGCVLCRLPLIRAIMMDGVIAIVSILPCRM